MSPPEEARAPARRPRLLVLTQYFPPEMGAPQARLSELGERLVDLGWEVEVLTALPNYPGGRVFPGYPRWRPTVDRVGRLRTVRVPLVPARRGFARRLLCYFSFLVSAALLGPRHCRRPDLVLVESPPLFLGVAGCYLARRWRCPLVLNVSDLWPDSAVELGMLAAGSPPVRAAAALERWLYRRAAAVTGQSQEIVDAVAERAGGTPTRVVTNGVEPARFGPHLRTPEALSRLGPEPGPVFLYAGLLGHAQGLDQLLDLAASLPATAPGRIVLVGDGPRREELAQRLAGEAIDRVRLLGAVPRHEVPALLAAADVALVSLGTSLRGAVPSKIYEAMAAGLPILLVAGGEAARRVEEGPAGRVVAPGDPEALRRAFLELAADAGLRQRLGAAGRRLAETRYDRGAIAAGLDELLRGLLGPPGAAR